MTRNSDETETDLATLKGVASWQLVADAVVRHKELSDGRDNFIVEERFVKGVSK